MIMGSVVALPLRNLVFSSVRPMASRIRLFKNQVRVLVEGTGVMCVQYHGNLNLEDF